MSKLTRRGTLRAAWAAVAPGRRRACAASLTRLGILTDKSGPHPEGAGIRPVIAANAAIKDVGGDYPESKAGLLTADGGTKTDTNISPAGAWFEREGVDAIFAVPFWAGALALRAVAERRNKVLMPTGPATFDLTGRACGPSHMHRVFDPWSFPTDDTIFGNGRIRQDCPKIQDRDPFEAKDASASKHPWNYCRQLAGTPAEQAFRPEEGGCVLVKSKGPDHETRRFRPHGPGLGPA